METGYNGVRKALGAAVLAFDPDVNVYYYTPRTLVPPALIIQPARRTVSYRQGQGRGPSAEWHFNVILIVGEVDEEAAQDIAGELISPGSPLINALNATKLYKGYAQVEDGTVAEWTIGDSVYTHVQLSVCAYSP